MKGGERERTVVNSGDALPLQLNRDPLGAGSVDDTGDGSVLDNLGGSVVEGGDRLLILDEEERRESLAVVVGLSERGGEGGGGESVQLDLEAQRSSGDMERQGLNSSSLLSYGNAETMQSVGLGDDSLGAGTNAVAVTITISSSLNAGQGHERDQRDHDKHLHYVCFFTTRAKDAECNQVEV